MARVLVAQRSLKPPKGAETLGSIPPSSVALGVLPCAVAKAPYREPLDLWLDNGFREREILSAALTFRQGRRDSHVVFASHSSTGDPGTFRS